MLTSSVSETQQEGIVPTGLVQQEGGLDAACEGGGRGVSVPGLLILSVANISISRRTLVVNEAR